MKKFITSLLTVLIALAGIIIGAIWAFQSNWHWEPLLILIVSFLEVVLYTIFKITNRSENDEKNRNEQNVNVT